MCQTIRIGTTGGPYRRIREWEPMAAGTWKTDSCPIIDLDQPISKIPEVWSCNRSDGSISFDPMKRNPIEGSTNAAFGCRTPDTVEKYQYPSVIQTDQANRLSLIEVCCTGYSASRLMGVTVCRAQCGCQNGSCKIPGECECYDGFVRNDNGDCVFACPLGCQNGQCYLDGSCQCDPGYKLDETRRFCRPICSSGCGSSPRHNCTEPEVCGCSKGYQLTDDGCQPVCEPDCGIGGLCKDNNLCDCAPGYNLRDGVCQADCYQKCNNGVCVSRNRCICDPGYAYHEQSTMCVPV
ncbi:tenascin isoform X2 [Drosophila santomea]|uniref:tenascin isoform X2 n=1 Tax=Drosophila santomea TaxID=129105 RepID=UPI001CC98A53|nr:tenascin isoform X2 [Drosophila santomea]